jgi:hypothetical protein
MCLGGFLHLKPTAKYFAVLNILFMGYSWRPPYTNKISNIKVDI